MAADPKPERVCVAVFAGAQGVKGLIRLKTFTETADGVFALGALTDASGGRRFGIERTGTSKGMPVVRVDGIGDRTAAQKLTGTKVFAARDELPPAEDDDEFLHADLEGLPVELPDGTPLGNVRCVQDFGAGPLLEVATGGGASVLIPFTREIVPAVDIPNRRIVADPPPGLLDDEE